MTLTDKAIDLARQGVPVFPLLANKRPCQDGGFKVASADPATVARMFANPLAAMIGVPTGAVSGFDVLDVDPAGKTWMADHFFDLGQTRVHRTRREGFHYLFKHRDGVRNTAGRIAEGIDVRGDGGYIVWWPATGAPLYDESPVADMPDWLLETIEAAKAKTSPSGPKLDGPAVEAPETWDDDELQRVMAAMANRLEHADEGAKHDTLCRESVFMGGILYATGMDEDEAAEWLVSHLPSTVADEDAALKTALSGLAKGQRLPVPVLNAASEFASVPLPAEVPFVSEAVKEAAAAVSDGDVFDPWERKLPGNFPLDLLPPMLAEAAHDASNMTGADLAATAMAMLTTLSACVDHRTAVKVTRHSKWTESPRLWVMLVGDPSAKKTPVLNGAIAPLEAHQNRAMEAYAMAKDLWEKTPKAERVGQEPQPARFLLNDITVEKIADILARSHRGALLFEDELSGWIGSMERYGKQSGGANRAFWLKAFNGGSFVQDRIGRGTIHVRNLSMSILGGIQPDKLRTIGVGLSDDGLLQRFLPVLMGPTRAFVDRAPGAALATYDSHAEALLQLPPRLLRLDEAGHGIKEAAFATFREWEGAGHCGKAFTSWAGKAPAFMMRLALALHYADPASIDNIDGLLPASVIEAAAGLMTKFAMIHAVAFYEDLGSTVSENTKAIAYWLLSRKSDVVRMADLSAGPRCLRDIDSKTLADRIAPLENGGWIVSETTVGRSRKWTLAPGLRERFENRARAAMESRARMNDLIDMASEKKAKGPV